MGPRGRRFGSQHMQRHELRELVPADADAASRVAEVEVVEAREGEGARTLENG